MPVRFGEYRGSGSSPVGGGQGMIDMTKLREITRDDPELNRVVMAEPLQLSEQDFLSKFSLLWNLSKKEVRK